MAGAALPGRLTAQLRPPSPPQPRQQLPGRLPWRAAEVVAVTAETADAESIALDVPGWPGHLAGQHVDVRLTAEDGYTAQRSYSIASPPEEPRVVLTIARVRDGEVSAFLLDELRAGDRLEMRGPIGGYFTWDASQGGPLLLVGGGSGVVPLMAMVRHRFAAGSDVPVRLLYSSRTAGDILYREELDRLAALDPGFGVVHTLTRSQPDGWTGYGRRIDREMLAEVGWPAGERPHVFVCGPTPLVESVSAALTGLGHELERVKTERFGPTGGDPSGTDLSGGR